MGGFSDFPKVSGLSLKSKFYELLRCARQRTGILGEKKGIWRYNFPVSTWDLITIFSSPSRLNSKNIGWLKKVSLLDANRALIFKHSKYYFFFFNLPVVMTTPARTFRRACGDEKFSVKSLNLSTTKRATASANTCGTTQKCTFFKNNKKIILKLQEH